MARQLVDTGGRLLNHVELVYRPGERQRVAALFRALGCGVIETGGPYLVVRVAPDGAGFLHNVLYASEATEAQLRFEEALSEALSNGKLADAHRGWRDSQLHEPQRTTHFGLRLASSGELDEILARIEAQPELGLAVAGVFRPGDPGALSDTLIQVFLHTELCAAGLVCLGQHIELQVDLSAAS